MSEESSHATVDPENEVLPPSRTSARWNLALQKKDRNTWNAAYQRLQSVEVADLSSVDMEEILNLLSTITFPNPRIRGEDCGVMLTALCQVIPSNSALLYSEFGQLVRKLLAFGKIVLSKEQIEMVIPFSLEVIQKSSSWFVADALKTLGAILLDNADKCAIYYEKIFSLTYPYLLPSSADLNAKLEATQCIGSIYYRRSPEGTTCTLMKKAYDCFLINYRQFSIGLQGSEDETLMIKGAIATAKTIMNILNIVMEEEKHMYQLKLNTLTGTLRKFMSYGFDLQRLDGEPHLHYRDVEETDNEHRSFRYLASRLRSTSLECVHSIAKHFPNTIYNAISLYLPEKKTKGMVLYRDCVSILTLLIYDPTKHVRLQASTTLGTIIDILPLALWFPEKTLTTTSALESMRESVSCSSHTPMSQKMIDIIYELHSALLFALQNEEDLSILKQIIKTCTSLIKNCPYSRIPTRKFEQLLPQFMDTLSPLLRCVETSVRSAVVSCLIAVLGYPKPLLEIEKCLTKEDPPKMKHQEEMVNYLKIPTLSSRTSMLEQLFNCAIDSPVAAFRLESLLLLSRIAPKYASAIRNLWNLFSKVLLSSFRDGDANIRLQAVKVLEGFIRGNVPTLSSSGILIQEETNTTLLPECLDFLGNHLPRAFQDTSHNVRASVCSCYVFLRSQDWEILYNEFTGKYFIDIFVNAAKDESVVVRAAVFKLLGAIALLPINKNVVFVRPVVETLLEGMSHQALNVRVRASWSLSNICNSIGPPRKKSNSSPCSSNSSSSNSYGSVGDGFSSACSSCSSCCTNDNNNIVELLSLPLIDTIFLKMVTSVDDNNKVSSNAIRTLGCLGQWIGCSHQFSPWLDEVKSAEYLEKIMLGLSSKVTDGLAKVRWNACCAISKIFKSPELPLASASWAPVAFAALTAAVGNSDNFKVQINASLALQVPSSRAVYGLSYSSIVHSLVSALLNTNKMQDIGKFKYKESFVLQVSCTLMHILALSTEDDIVILRDILIQFPVIFIEEWMVKQKKSLLFFLLSTPSSDDSCSVENGEGDDSVDPIQTSDVVAACDIILKVIDQLPQEYHCCHELIHQTKHAFETITISEFLSYAG